MADITGPYPIQACQSEITWLEYTFHFRFSKFFFLLRSDFKVHLGGIACIQQIIQVHDDICW